MRNRPAESRSMTDDMTMHAVMAAWPQVVPVLLRAKIHCVGCVLASFHTVKDAETEHQISNGELLLLMESITSRDVWEG